MTYEIEQDNILSREMRIKIYDVRGFPLVIHDPRITEMHCIRGTETLIGLTAVGIKSENANLFIITPSEAQTGDWTWETFNNGIRFTGATNPMIPSFNMEFTLE